MVGLDGLNCCSTIGGLISCLAFEKPLFSDICWRSSLSFHMVNGHSAGFDFLKSDLGIGLPGFQAQPGLQQVHVLRLSPEITSYGKPDLTNIFQR